jgi:hypothetical protein
VQLTDAEQPSGISGLALTRACVLGFSVAAALARGQEDGVHALARAGVQPQRSSAADRLVVGMRAHDQHARHEACSLPS